MSCLDVTKGDDYDAILVKLNALVCDLQPPSGVATVVDSCSSAIAVTNVTSNGISTYTVCLDSAITDQIDENTNNILTINACLADTVKDLVSDSLTITEESVNDCGRTLRLEVLTPSGIPTYDGIIYNDLEKSGTSGAGGVQILKSFNNNYVTGSEITTGDEIRFQIIGQIDPTASGVDTVTIELFNSDTATILDATSYSAFSNSTGKLSSFVADGVIALQSATSGRYTLKLLTNNADNSSFSNAVTHVKAYDVNTIDFSALTIRVKYTNTSMATATSNYVYKLMVEVRKFIG